MDPGFVEAHWSALPHLEYLRRHGTFARLGTSDPPQSPVAWATFATGLSPDQHGIYDFVERDPATLDPFSSFGHTAGSALTLPIGPFRLPLTSAHIVELRRGITFWKLLADQGVPVRIMKIPDNYPPVRAGQELAGMGTPDLNGSLGTFTFYTADPGESNRNVDGGRIQSIAVQNGRAYLRLIGPPNTLRKDQRFTTNNLIADVDPERSLVRFTVGDQLLILKQGEWSDWLGVEFTLLRHLRTVTGTIRIFLKQVHPFLEVYVSPVNVDPLNPALPISYPLSWSKTIAQQTGRYATLGIPEDTAALRNGVFDTSEFRAQSRLVLDEEQKLLRYSLQTFKGGFLFYYFSAVDQNSHVFWDRDERSLLDVYHAVDNSIGEVLEAQPDAELIVMSDHGFTSFTRAVHLNTWLYNNGFLTLKGAPGDNTSLHDVKWSKTQAYAIGLNGLYLNLASREKYGIVHPGQPAEKIAEEIRADLLALRDPATGKQVISSITFTHPSSESAKYAPDMIIGYAPGYRASWQTALGGIPAAIVTDNNDEWIGDHCIAPAAVPGVFFSTSRAQLQHPRLQDVTATVLHLFGVKQSPAMDGNSIY